MGAKTLLSERFQIDFISKRNRWKKKESHSYWLSLMTDAMIGGRG
jgi:hypothetical protein